MNHDSIARITSIGRPLDPRQLSNLLVMWLSPLAGIAAAMVNILRGGGIGGAATDGLYGAAVAFAAWAVAREVAPDSRPSAFLSMILASATFLWLDVAGLLLLFTTLLLVRVVNRTTGLRARLTDSLLVLGLTIWCVFDAAVPLVAAVAALAFALDASQSRPVHRQWLFATLSLAAGAVFIVRHGPLLAPETPLSVVIAVTLVLIVVVYLTRIAGLRRVTSTGDVTGEPLSAGRVRGGMVVGLLMALAALASSRASFAGSALLWATLAGATLVRVTFGARLRVSAGRGPTDAPRGTPRVKSYRLYQVDAFTTETFAGNPAGVVPGADGLSDDEMQAIARELNNSETAFILPPQGDDHEVWVRFFTPTTEVPSCGHATIAAHYVRAVEQQLPSRTVIHKIGAGVLPVGIERIGSDYSIVMTQARPTFSEPFGDHDRNAIVTALGLNAADRDDRCPVQIVSTGHSKVLIGIRSLETLHALRPDRPGLAALSRRIGCNGYYVFVLTGDDGFLAHGRMFAPAIGLAEDPVTGNVNGPLGAYLVRHRLAFPVDGVLAFRARQGEALGRPGTLEVTVEADGTTPIVVRVAGRAVIVFRTEIAL